MNAEELLRSYPEFSTRPLLVKELGTNGEFRRDLMKVIHHLFEIASIDHQWVARYALTRYQEDGVKHVISKWYEHFERQDYHITNEMVGLLKNILTNVRMFVGMDERFWGVPKTGRAAETFVARAARSATESEAT